MGSNGCRHIAAAAVLAVAIVPAPAAPQALETGSLEGRVTDGSGSGLAGVRVTAASPALQGERSALSKLDGHYLLRGLPPGAYRVTFALAGMSPVRHAVRVELGLVSRLDTALTLAAATGEIEVTGTAAPALDSVVVGANFDACRGSWPPSGWAATISSSASSGSPARCGAATRRPPPASPSSPTS